MSPKKKAAKPEKPKETTPEMIASLAITVVLALFILTFNIQSFAIPTGSMEDTLLIGDHLFVNRISLAPKTSWMPLLPYREIRRGDIIVFNKPRENMILVKRAMGVPGDRLHLSHGNLYVNGQAIKEPYTIRSLGNYDPYRDEFPATPPSPYDPVTPFWRGELPQHLEGGDLVVPPGYYFAMGDNRQNSLDSRYWGFVPRENVLGTPLIIYWSFETPRDEYMKTSLSDRLASTLHEIIHFVDQTRWRRTGRVLH